MSKQRPKEPQSKECHSKECQMKECQCEWKISNVKQGPNGLSDPVGSEEWQPPRRGVRRRIASPGEGEVLSEVYRMVVVVSGKTWIVAYSSVSRFWIFAAEIAAVSS